MICAKNAVRWRQVLFYDEERSIFCFFCTLYAQIALVKSQRASLCNSFRARIHTIELYFKESDFFFTLMEYFCRKKKLIILKSIIYCF